MSVQASNQLRKPYVQPRLEKCGNVAKNTRKNLRLNTKDNAGHDQNAKS